MPTINNDYLGSLYREQCIQLSASSLQKPYSQETLFNCLTWNNIIKGESILSICSNEFHDNSVQLFHQFAQRWTLGHGHKSYKALAHICDVNGTVAEDLNRADLKATWQAIKMLYNDHDNIQKHRRLVWEGSRSIPTSHSINNDKKHNYRSHYRQFARRLCSIDKQQYDTRLDNRPTNEERTATDEQRVLSSPKSGKIKIN